MSNPSGAPAESYGSGAPTEPAEPEAKQPGGRAAQRPFRSVPAADWVRDGVAIVLLYASLTRPWDTTTVGQGRIEVLIITVLSMISLAVPYLARIGALPPSWTVSRTRAARALLNAPFVVLTLVYIVFDITHTVGGLGAGMALGLAGAVLAAAPRECEIAPADRPEPSSGNWLLGFDALAALTLLGALTAFVWGLVDLSGGQAKTLVVVQAVFIFGLVGLPAVGVALRNPSARLVMIGLGLVVVIGLYKGIVGASMTATLSSGGTFSPLFFFDDLRNGSFGLVLTPALGALAASAPIGRAMRAERPGVAWRRAAVLGFVLIGVLALVVLVRNIVNIGFDAEGASTGWIIAVAVNIVLALAIGACALFGWRSLAGPTVRRGVSVAWLVAILACGVAIIAISHRTVFGLGRFGVLTFMELYLLGIALPLLVIGMLTIPKSIRELSEPAAAQAWVWAPPAPRPQPQAFAGAQPQQPYRQPQPQGVTRPAQQGSYAPPEASSPATQPVGFTAEQARDPNTPLAVLAQIAQDAPQLRADIAANPSTYPALLEWLGNLGDPAVDAALKARD